VYSKWFCSSIKRWHRAPAGLCHRLKPERFPAKHAGCTYGVRDAHFTVFRPDPILLPESFCDPLRRRPQRSLPGPSSDDIMQWQKPSYSYYKLPQFPAACQDFFGQRTHFFVLTDARKELIIGLARSTAQMCRIHAQYARVSPPAAPIGPEPNPGRTKRQSLYWATRRGRRCGTDPSRRRRNTPCSG